MGKMCSLLPLDHRIHKTECFMLKGLFFNNLPPNIRKRTSRIPESLQPRQTKFGNLPPKGASTQSPQPLLQLQFKKMLPQHSQSMSTTRPALRAAPCPAPRSACSPAPSSSQNSDHCLYHHNHRDQAQRCCPPAPVPGN